MTPCCLKNELNSEEIHVEHGMNIMKLRETVKENYQS